VDKLYTSIAAERCNEYGAIIKKHQPHQKGKRSSQSAKKPRVDTTGMDESDPEDSDFMSDGSLAGSSEDGDTEVDDAQPLMAEVYFRNIILRTPLTLLFIDC